MNALIATTLTSVVLFGCSSPRQGPHGTAAFSPSPFVVRAVFGERGPLLVDMLFTGRQASEQITFYDAPVGCGHSPTCRDRVARLSLYVLDGGDPLPLEEGSYPLVDVSQLLPDAGTPLHRAAILVSYSVVGDSCQLNAVTGDERSGSVTVVDAGTGAGSIDSPGWFGSYDPADCP
jgi:hypothetical protein